MHRTMLVALAGMSVVISGCAGQHYSQELSRMKSDMGLLDQRVAQLERTGVQTPSGSVWPSDAAIQPLTSAAPSTTSALSSGVKPSKKQIQQALKNAGFYEGPIDGKIGQKSREAIRQFQQVNGLKADGVAGALTWAKLSPYLDLSGDPASTASVTEPIK